MLKEVGVDQSARYDARKGRMWTISQEQDLKHSQVVLISFYSHGRYYFVVCRARHRELSPRTDQSDSQWITTMRT